MSKRLKFLVGLVAALVAGVISHGPLGQGEAFVQELEAPLQPLFDELKVSDVTGRVQREPFARVVLLSGPASCFQRNGLDTLPGLDRRVAALPGVAHVEWTNPPPEGEECR